MVIWMKVNLTKKDMEAICFLLAYRINFVKLPTDNELGLMKKLKLRFMNIDHKIGIAMDKY